MLPKEVTDWNKQYKDVEFTDTIRVSGIVRGRSAAHFIALSQTEKVEYTIFIKDLLDMMKRGMIDGDMISGTFIVKKRGRNLGIRLKDVPEYKEKIDFSYKNIFPEKI